MCNLHTFSRDLKCNLHIHVLYTDGKSGNTNVFRIIKHINFKALRLRWQKLLLDYLSNTLPHSELPNFLKIYTEYNKSFYVYAKPVNFFFSTNN